jgi:hypothetical protein
MTDGPVARLLWCALDALAQLLRHAITDDHYRSHRELLSAHRRCVARSQVVGRARRWGAETAATRVRSSKRPVTSGTRGNHSALTNL